MTMPVVVALVPDLMDRSKVQAAGGDRVRFVARADALVDAARAEDATRAVVDLGRPGAIDALPDLVAAGIEVVGFGSHVDVDLLERARAAGCHEVLPRSAFFRRLAELLGAG